MLGCVSTWNATPRFKTRGALKKPKETVAHLKKNVVSIVCAGLPLLASGDTYDRGGPDKKFMGHLRRSGAILVQIQFFVNFFLQV